MNLEKEKLERSLGGISEMRKLPNIIFVIDTNIESLAVLEAKKLNIPIIGIQIVILILTILIFQFEMMMQEDQSTYIAI